MSTFGSVGDSMLLAEVHHFGLRVEIWKLKQASYWTHEYRECTRACQSTSLELMSLQWLKSFPFDFSSSWHSQNLSFLQVDMGFSGAHASCKGQPEAVGVAVQASSGQPKCYLHPVLQCYSFDEAISDALT